MPDESLQEPCPCESGYPFAACCAPFLAGIGVAPTALATMRSRYTAYVRRNSRYLLDSWHPSTRPSQLLLDPNRHWLGLRIKQTQQGEAGDQHGIVEFVARYKTAGRAARLHERSRFVFEQERWLYVEGEVSN